MASRRSQVAVLRTLALVAMAAGALVGCATRSAQPTGSVAPDAPAIETSIETSIETNSASVVTSMSAQLSAGVPTTTTQTARDDPQLVDPQLVDLTGPTSEFPFDVEDWRGYLQFFDEPQSTANVVAFHEPGARAIKTTGRYVTDAAGLAWREVTLAADRTGWLPADIAVPSPGTQIDFSQMPCRTDGVTTGEVALSAEAPSEASTTAGPTANPAASPTGSPSVAVAQMWQARGPNCDRVALAFTRDSYEPTGELLTSLPSAVMLKASDSRATLRIDDVNQIRFDADYDLGRFDDSVAAVAGRTPDGEVIVELFAPQRSTFALTVLANPARVLIDVAPASLPDEPVPDEPVPDEPVPDEPVPDAPVAGVVANASVTLIVDPANGATLTADDTIVVSQLPATFRGYARWFEANGSAQLSTADHQLIASRASGASVWTEPVGDLWGLTINDYIDAAGSFTFTLDEAPPEARLLFVGSCGENDPTPDLPNYRVVPGGRYCNYNGVVAQIEVPR